MPDQNIDGKGVRRIRQDRLKSLQAGLDLMADNKMDKPERKKPVVRKKDRATEIANTFEWLITAFALAFVFRAFVMEAFRIPTGSMADTLLGAHYMLRCTECGYKYYYGYNEPGAKSRGIHQDHTRCPSCGYYQATPAVPGEGHEPINESSTCSGTPRDSPAGGG